MKFSDYSDAVIHPKTRSKHITPSKNTIDSITQNLPSDAFYLLTYQVSVLGSKSGPANFACSSDTTFVSLLK